MNGMPVFVKIEEYKDVLEVLSLLTKKIERAKDIIARINELKSEENSELEMWEKELSEVENKVEFMNRTLTEPGI